MGDEMKIKKTVKQVIAADGDWYVKFNEHSEDPTQIFYVKVLFWALVEIVTKYSTGGSLHPMVHFDRETVIDFLDDEDYSIVNKKDVPESER